MADDPNKPAPPKKAKAAALSADIDAPFRGAAGGVGAITSALNHAITEMGVIRSARALLRINQADGFDCPGCAWPEPKHRSAFEFCENGAKAIAADATRARVTPDFFAQHTISALLARSDQWLEAQGRLTAPMLRRAGSDHYAPISWDEAFALVGDALRGHSRTPTRRSSTPRVGPATRRRSSTSSSRGSWAPTTSRTAPTCATSPAASAWGRRSASARAP
jgi:anaerobic selenocysteine-containing dehydrogenase